MKRVLFALFGLLLFHLPALAQDLVVTHGGDSISVAPIKELPRWSIGASMGYAHRTIAFYNAGVYIDFDVTRFIGEKRIHGIGVRYSESSSGGARQHVFSRQPYTGMGNYSIVEYSYSYTSSSEAISTLGVFGSYRIKGNRHCLIFRYGLGLMFYNHYSRYSSTWEKHGKGTTLGVFGDVGYSFKITKHLSLGLKGGFAGGLVTSLWVEEKNGYQTRYSQEDLDKDNRRILDLFKVGLDLRLDI